MDGAIPHGLLALLSPELIERLLSDVAEVARQKWVNAAANTLQSSKRDYIDSIQPVESRPGLRLISLVGWLANAVENGKDPWRLRDTLLNAGARVSKAGWRYRAIPFRHSTPGAKTHQAGAPMGSRLGPTAYQSKGTAGVMTRGEAHQFGVGLYKIAKRLGQRRYKHKRGASSAQMVQERITAAQGGPKLAPWHSAGIYTGMQKGGAPGHKGYTTFRMISENPEIKDAGSKWIHPGISARHLVREATDGLQSSFTQVLRNAVRQATRGGFR